MMNEILSSIYEYPWTFAYLIFGIKFIWMGFTINYNKHLR